MLRFYCAVFLIVKKLFYHNQLGVVNLGWDRPHLELHFDSSSYEDRSLTAIQICHWILKRLNCTYRCLRKKVEVTVLGYVILQNCTNPASIESTVNLLLFFSSEIYHLPSAICSGHLSICWPNSLVRVPRVPCRQKSISSEAQLWKKLFNLETMPLSYF